MDMKDKPKPQMKSELAGTLVTQTTHTEKADIAPTTVPTSVTPQLARKSKHKQIAQDIPLETTLTKVQIVYQETIIHR
jgi:hypothetical protein